MLTHFYGSFMAQAFPILERPINWHHPTVLWNGQKGDMSWVFAIVFATILTLAGFIALALTARANRPPKPEPVRPTPGPTTGG